MKKLFLLFILAFSLPLLAQHQGQSQPFTGNITSAGSTCNSSNCLLVAIPSDAASATVTVTGTFSATAAFEICGDTDANCRSTVGVYSAINAYPVPTGTTVTATSATGVWQVNVAGFTMLRIRGSAFSSGTLAAMVTLGFAGTGIYGPAFINQADVTGNGVEIAPTASALAGISTVSSTAIEASHIFKASAGNLYGMCITAGASAGFLMIFDAVTAPADGAVTPKDLMQVAANGTACISFGAGPPSSYATGITAVLSTTGPLTKTASATGYFQARFK